MTVPAKLDELYLRNTAESWADSPKPENGRRLPHNSGKNQPLNLPVFKRHLGAEISNWVQELREVKERMTYLESMADYLQHENTR